ncbi:hypothetical protein CFBP6600_40840 [Xanthomonas arboricola pv. corylina]|uniref:Uncharacterized protein n=1 Tax=Xanthomonas arboricola pv. corylina TaxID=487821 RepID=A0ABM8T215_9XANT|nr:hypothetical protein XAC301_41120 [Xanthomonas arboricola pv. corylina]CAE6850791.1 hypothetical protein XAC301_41120 [Xanthomonas arboricola pv. corylina]CAE6851155.1 hypothetical protein CFBP6600_40840 [Xanthomonas arboricola pv. corylina]CAE6851179.1 hypothetical protein CFBP6600_40840 [Xanthomonas arboricola pv. corylina]
MICAIWHGHLSPPWPYRMKDAISGKASLYSLTTRLKRTQQSRKFSFRWQAKDFAVLDKLNNIQPALTTLYL